MSLTRYIPTVDEELRRDEIACRKISLAIRRYYGLQVDWKAISILGEMVFNLSPYMTRQRIEKWGKERLVV